MAIRVDHAEGVRLVEIVADGAVTRREAGWATERTRELLGKGGVDGIIADCRGAEPQVSPALSAELMENFVFAVETDLPIAYVRPRGWTSAYREQVDRLVNSLIDATQRRASLFDTREAAMAWFASSPERTCRPHGAGGGTTDTGDADAKDAPAGCTPDCVC